MCTGVEIMGAIGAVSALASMAKTAYDMSQGGGGSTRVPSPAAPDYTQMMRSMRPTATANAAAQTGGGMSPQLIQGVLDQEVGMPGGALGIIDEIRKSLGESGQYQTP